MELNVSGICEKDGKKLAYVMFIDDNREAEGVIPECKITRNKGFTEDELKKLEEYMKENIDMLKKQATTVNPITAFMK